MADLDLTEAQNGESFALRVGEAIVVTLPENPSTGYRWSTDSLNHNLLLQEAHDFHSGGPGVGSGGTVVWRFRAKGNGQTRLELKKVRSWEPRAEPVSKFEIALSIS